MLLRNVNNKKNLHTRTHTLSLLTLLSRDDKADCYTSTLTHDTNHINNHIFFIHDSWMMEVSLHFWLAHSLVWYLQQHFILLYLVVKNYSTDCYDYTHVHKNITIIKVILEKKCNKIYFFSIIVYRYKCCCYSNI